MQKLTHRHFFGGLVLFLLSSLCFVGCAKKEQTVASVSPTVQNDEPLQSDAFISVVSVLIDNVRLRSSPSLNGDIITLFKKDEPLLILKRDTILYEIDGLANYWLNVQTMDDVKGWVFGGYVSRDQGYSDYTINYFEIPTPTAKIPTNDTGVVGVYTFDTLDSHTSDDIIRKDIAPNLQSDGAHYYCRKTVIIISRDDENDCFVIQVDGLITFIQSFQMTDPGIPFLSGKEYGGWTNFYDFYFDELEIQLCYEYRESGADKKDKIDYTAHFKKGQYVSETYLVDSYKIITEENEYLDVHMLDTAVMHIRKNMEDNSYIFDANHPKPIISRIESLENISWSNPFWYGGGDLGGENWISSDYRYYFERNSIVFYYDYNAGSEDSDQNIKHLYSIYYKKQGSSVP